MYVPKNKGASSSKEEGDLKMISVHLNFINTKEEPIFDTIFFDFVPRSVMIKNMLAKTPKDSRCIIKELDKDDNTCYYALSLDRGIKQYRLLGGNPIVIFTFIFYFWCVNMIIATLMIMFAPLHLKFVPSKAFRMIVDLNLCRNRNFCVQYLNYHSVLELHKILKFYTILGCRYFIHSNFSDFVELHKDDLKFHNYVLFYFRQILF